MTGMRHAWRSSGMQLTSMPPQDVQTCRDCGKARRLIRHEDGRERVAEWPYGAGLPEERCPTPKGCGYRRAPDANFRCDSDFCPDCGPDRL